MIEEGDRVRIHPREGSDASLKYAGHTGHVTMIAPSPSGPTLYVQVDGNAFDTAFGERELSEIVELDQWEIELD